jgi:hypothetical protein
MDDRPTAEELIDAVRLFLERELLPALGDARLRFQTLVAANALAIAGRELAGAEKRWCEELIELTTALDAPIVAPADFRQEVRGANEELCRRIRAGAFDEPGRFRELLALARRQVVRKLGVTNPRYLATPAGPP